ncbi:MAG: phosphatase PAP2 family protein [Candidatus Colwellbacteria bacterium]|nr:phosphatase PAP2 family protein [Candidatus Colwellbacteria bacterium]
MDQQVFLWLYNLANKNQLLDWFSVFLADYLFYVLIIVFLWVVFKEKDWRRRFYLIALTGIAIILSRGIATPIIRYFYDRPRPFIADNIEPLINHIATHSFPSGHLAIFTPIFLILFLINRRLGFWFFIGAILIGIGRVATGVHWPSDILGGILIGAVSFFTTFIQLCSNIF